MINTQDVAKVHVENTDNTYEICDAYVEQIVERCRAEHANHCYAAVSGRLHGSLLCILNDLQVDFPEAYKKIIKRFA